MNIKESIENSKKVLPTLSDDDENKLILSNQITIMESLTELKRNLQEVAMAVSNG
jgi:kynurenine formamidase